MVRYSRCLFPSLPGLFPGPSRLSNPAEQPSKLADRASNQCNFIWQRHLPGVLDDKFRWDDCSWPGMRERSNGDGSAVYGHLAYILDHHQRIHRLLQP